MKKKTLYIYIGLLFVLFLIINLIFKPKINFSNQADGFAYTLPLRSLYFDRDLNFYNENITYENTYNCLPYDWRQVTKTANYYYPYSIGPSLLWSPFFLFATSSQKINLLNPLASSLKPQRLLSDIGGYSQKDLNYYTHASRFYGTLAVIFSFLLIGNFFSNEEALAFFAVIITALATPFFYYFIYQPLMAHILAAFACSIFLFLWSRNIGKLNSLRFIYLGVGLGLVTLVRWQDVIFLIFPLTEIIFFSFKNRFKNWRLSTLLILLFFGFSFSVISVQLIFWKIIFGSFWVIPQSSQFFRLPPPFIREFLFSFRHGLFSWSPVIFLSIAGLILPWQIFSKNKKDPRTLIMIINSWVVLLLAIFINGSLVDWHASDSFGARRIVSLFPVFVFSLFSFLVHLGKKLRWIFIFLTIFLALYNVIFAWLYFQSAFSHFIEIRPMAVIRKIFE